ncbi:MULTISPECIES: PQ-loop domain-containing transporter [Gammaproteobacteria]|uniref:PQ-loop repeat-containing protein n=1 Tax=Pseudomonas tritici TaxID=2745518 RepID=A0A8H9YQX3_9PSED
MGSYIPSRNYRRKKTGGLSPPVFLLITVRGLR